MQGHAWAECVGVEWVQMKPVSLTSEVRRLARQKPDFIWIATNTTHVIGTIKAMKELGIHIPLVLASHCGIQMSALASKDITLLEGHYDSYAMDPAIDRTVPGAKVVIDYSKKLGIKDNWSIVGVQAAAMQLLTLRGIERAVEKVGADKVTGEAVFNAMFEKTFTEEELLGLAPALTFTSNAPFSEKDLKVRATTVKDGKQVMVTDEWIPVPEIPKWVGNSQQATNAGTRGGPSYVSGTDQRGNDLQQGDHGPERGLPECPRGEYRGSPRGQRSGQNIHPQVHIRIGTHRRRRSYARPHPVPGPGNRTHGPHRNRSPGNRPGHGKAARCWNT